MHILLLKNSICLFFFISLDSVSIRIKLKRALDCFDFSFYGNVFYLKISSDPVLGFEECLSGFFVKTENIPLVFIYLILYILAGQYNKSKLEWPY